MSHQSTADWERIELLYRAGKLSIREIAKQCAVTDTAIRKRAKRDGWERDLSEKIDASVRRQMVRAQVRAANPEARARTDKELVDSAVETEVSIRMAHRGAIARSRRIGEALKEHLEKLLEEGIFPKQFGALAGIYATIAGAEKTYIALERQAFGITEEGGKTEESFEQRMIRMDTEAKAAKLTEDASE